MFRVQKTFMFQMCVENWYSWKLKYIVKIMFHAVVRVKSPEVSTWKNIWFQLAHSFHGQLEIIYNISWDVKFM